ncbi:MAG: GNAT family N-acetyltransferase [Defluviimonas sp.]|uniref:GNAT family N-acetyltransferase n=1 Tax=Albidovulum sp. TaxID=1872424 RepID=UPI002A341D78|nr:GNAT family N-acetyltransferase [Defluviimonas sp.]
MTDVTFRELAGMSEMRAAENVQRSVWGAGDVPDPADLMMVIQAEGGLVGGAFVEGRLMGYVFGFPTRDPAIQHSHRLAVLSEARGLGLGLRLKHYQRDWCLAQGISRVRWTFDPLRAANAALNIHRLGAGADTYFVDYYGEMEGINRGIASDRLLADWDLGSAAAQALSAGRSRPRGDGPESFLDLPLPNDLDALLASDPEAASRLRLDLRQALLDAFADGARIVDFDKASRRYLLGGQKTGRDVPRPGGSGMVSARSPARPLAPRGSSTSRRGG